MKYALYVILFLIVLFSVACTVGGTAPYVPGQRSDAYGLVHGSYVGQAIVRTTSDGFLDVSFDEAFLPHTLAAVDMEDTAWNEDNTVYYISRGEEHRVARYVEYDGTIYVGATVGGALTYVQADESGNPAGNSDLERNILRNEATMAAWFTNIQNGQFKVLTSFAGTAQAVTGSDYGGLTKRQSPGYWSFGQTWVGNVTAVERFAEEFGVGFGLDEMVRSGTEDADGLKKWAVADVVTAATMVDFKDYFAVIQTASGRLKTQ